ncbi:DUF763 domain-containing protein [Bradyrhizobium sp. GCM10027634]|uniref:DUF763 domain-containing protein n=1 Tax=unclassified Bradyrhizobium TaxID=2631580 RepID=UPI00188D8A84|nr:MULTISPECIES: DUF763 domain-containing protein [unclassified Bradyrhizobium]MDN5001540.1 DUF763 domain-containing protein [Bradyrhizobium sp. WYCCWR 12677]QOZ46121.1 DUF763 domain-containing protein [Bradyrhizobium sp. CCBAU 53340]
MTRRTGSADLPLHTGRVPPWLASRMASLGAIVTQAIVLHYGRDAFMQRLSHPFWFQSFGAVMGMDWHSSGITTSVIGALKRGLGPLQDELGIYVCGGRGQHSRKTPDELLQLGNRVGFDGAKLTRSSRLVAKVDSAAVQDGFDLYLHGFFVTADGKWTVVQQGMNGDKRQARRYHWHSEALKSFVDAPHSAIDGPQQGEIVNLTDHRADVSRSAQLELLSDLGPDRILAEFERLSGSAPEPAQAMLPHLIMPAHHDIRPKDVFARRLHGTLAAAAERGPVDFPELLLTPGVGARTVRSLAMVAEVVHGAPYRFKDPARFSLAHGGKDRHPYPVPIKVYDETIRVLKGAIQNAKLGREEEMQAIKRLDDQARRLERTASGPSVESFIAGERAASTDLDGRSVFGWERDLVAAKKSTGS